MAMRHWVHIFHRWLGLTIAAALVVTGLTGAILPFQHEITDWVAPDIMGVTQPKDGAAALSGLELARKVESETGAQVSYIALSPRTDRALAVFVSPAPGQPAPAFNEVFIDPNSGALTGAVNYGALSEHRVNLMPFVLSVHYTLAAGQTGRTVLGIAALLWLVMSLTGLILSLPAAANSVQAFFRRWKPAWLVRTDKGSTVLVHDVHRASSLWIWPLMLVFAWSAVAFNLPQVHVPVQRALGAEGLYPLVTNPSPAQGDVMTWETAVANGEKLMAKEAKARGFSIYGPTALSLAPYANAMGYYARTTLDNPSNHGSTVVWFDQVSGEQIGFGAPFGFTAADASEKALHILHTADGLGWPYRVAVSLFGLTTAGSAIAGVLLWYRRLRRKARPAPQGLAA